MDKLMTEGKELAESQAKPVPAKKFQTTPKGPDLSDKDEGD